MKQTPMTLEEIHEATVELLKGFIEVCDKAQVEYRLAYGTLLGAVRHKGFIPWDDDLDVVMFRPDYEKFVSYCINNKESIKPFRLISKENMPSSYLINIARFCDTRYRMQTRLRHDTGIDLFMDILVMDGAGNSRDEAMNALGSKRQRILDKLHFSTIFIHKKMPMPVKILLTPAWIIYTLILQAGYGRRLLDELESLKDAFPLESSSYVGSLVWFQQYRSFKKSCIEEYKLMPFEGVMAKCPKDHDEFLVTQYGDYMQLPPEDKRQPKHHYWLYRR